MLPTKTAPGAFRSMLPDILWWWGAGGVEWVVFGGGVFG